MDDIIDFLYEIKQEGQNSLLCRAFLRMLYLRIENHRQNSLPRTGKKIIEQRNQHKSPQKIKENLLIATQLLQFEIFFIQNFVQIVSYKSITQSKSEILAVSCRAGRDGEVILGGHGLQQGNPAEDLLFCLPNTSQVSPYRARHWQLNSSSWSKWGGGEVALGSHGLQQGRQAEDLLFCRPKTSQVSPCRDRH